MSGVVGIPCAMDALPVRSFGPNERIARLPVKRAISVSVQIGLISLVLASDPLDLDGIPLSGSMLDQPVYRSRRPAVDDQLAPIPA